MNEQGNYTCACNAGFTGNLCEKGEMAGREVTSCLHYVTLETSVRLKLSSIHCLFQMLPNANHQHLVKMEEPVLMKCTLPYKIGLAFP